MADMLSERLREFARHIDDYTRGIDPPLIEEAAAELDRREAIVAAAEAWAKAYHQLHSDRKLRNAVTDQEWIDYDAAMTALLALLPRGTL